MLEGDNGYTRIFGRPLGAFDTPSDDSKKLSILKGQCVGIKAVQLCVISLAVK